MSEQPALKDDAVASFIVTIRDLVKAERERNEALRLHVEDHARIDALLAERDRARDVAVKLEQAADHLGARLLLSAIYPESRPPGDGAPRWDEDAIVLRFGWLAGRCGRCGEELKAESVTAERDEALAALARVRALAEESPWGTSAATLRAALEGPS